MSLEKLSEETRTNLRKRIKDILEQFVQPLKVTTASMPLIHVDKALDDIEDAFVQAMPYTIKLDADVHFNLERLKAYYYTDEGHILRALLKERLKRIDELSKL